jgi:hypothetical protein
MSTRPLGQVANHLLFENERVRVWRMELTPGEASHFHEHTLPSASVRSIPRRRPASARHASSPVGGQQV